MLELDNKSTYIYIYEKTKANISVLVTLKNDCVLHLLSKSVCRERYFKCLKKEFNKSVLVIFK